MWTPDKNGGEIKDTIDFGNAPEGTCVTVPASEVYWSEDPDGSWSGLRKVLLQMDLPIVVPWVVLTSCGSMSNVAAQSFTQDQNSTDANQPK